MRKASIPVLGFVLGCLAIAAALLAAIPATPALAQPSPIPQDCVCSPGVNLSTSGTPVVIRHCQCGILSCAVVVSSGQLQCLR